MPHTAQTDVGVLSQRGESSARCVEHRAVTRRGRFVTKAQGISADLRKELSEALARVEGEGRRNNETSRRSTSYKQATEGLEKWPESLPGQVELVGQTGGTI